MLGAKEEVPNPVDRMIKRLETLPYVPGTIDALTLTKASHVPMVLRAA